MGQGGGTAVALDLGAPAGSVPTLHCLSGEQASFKSKIKNPSAHSRPAFTANGHLTQLN